MQQLTLPLAERDRIGIDLWLMGLPREWDRTHPAYLRYGLGPVLDVPRSAVWSLRAEDRVEES